LDPARFVRIHRAHIVNLDHVVRFQREGKDRLVAELTDGTRLAVSRHRAQDVRGLGA
jgi:two-component system LytT family response regulator